MADGPARVVVVGGGIAGLATAWLVRERARSADRAIELTVLEERRQPGGSTRTDRMDGYLCEWGPNGFLNNEPKTLELVELLGMKDRLLPASEASAHRFIYHSGRMHELPLSPPAFLAADVVGWPAKLRMAAEVFIPPRRDGEDETVYDFGRRRLGSEFSTYLLDPMVSGIFAGNTRALSLRAVFPKMAELEGEHGGLFRALAAKKWQALRTGAEVGGPSGPRGTLHTFRTGMGELTEQLAADLDGHIHTSQPVQAIATHKGTDGPFQVHTADQSLTAEVVVLACPAPAAATIAKELDPPTATALRGIWHAPVDVVCHGYRFRDVARMLDGFGVLIPRREGIRSLGTLLSDCIFPGQAPRGRHLLRTMVGGAHDPAVSDLTDELLHQQVHDDLRTLFGVTRPPTFSSAYRHPLGIAQYNVGHLERVAATERLERALPGLLFTGASYRGVSVNGCIKDAFRLADRIDEVLGG